MLRPQGLELRCPILALVQGSRYILVCGLQKREVAMHSRALGKSEIMKRVLARIAACGGVFVLAVSPLVGTRSAAAAVTVAPATLQLKAKVGKITYGMVTITNTGSSVETLTSATGDPRPPFW